MPATISDLIARIRGRLVWGGSEDILSEEAVRELWALATLCQVTTFDDLAAVHPSAAHAAASLCWARYLALPEDVGQADLELALAGFRACFDPAATVAPVWVREYLMRTANSEVDSDIRLFSRAVLRARHDVAETGDDSERYLAATCRLQQCLRSRGWLTASVSDFDEAIALARRDLETYASETGAHSTLASALLEAIVMRHITAPLPAADLSDAIATGEAELQRLEPAGAPFREMVNFYTYAASAYAKTTNEWTVLDHALRWLTLGLSSAEASATLIVRDRIADLHETRFQLTGREADLERAIVVSSHAADATARTDMLWPARWQRVAELYRAAYLRSGSRQHRDECIRTMREVVEATRTGDPTRVDRMSCLGEMLLRRYLKLRGFGDLVEAVRLYDALLELVPEDDPRRGDVIRHAIGAYCARGTHDQESTVFLDRAIALGEDVLPVAGFETLANLIQALLQRAAREQVSGASAADLDRAVELAQFSVDRGQNAEQVSIALGQLSEALLGRYDAGKSAEDLDRATEAARRAAAIDTPMDRARTFLWLGGCLERGPSSGIAEAIANFRRAATAGTDEIPVRLTAAQAWGKFAAGHQEFAEAQAGYGVALELLREAVDERLTWNHRMKLLVDHGTLVSDAVAAALRNDDLDAAVGVIYSGRALLWTDLAKAHREEALLRRLAPHLAKRYRECLETLESYQLMEAAEATQSFRDSAHAMYLLIRRTHEHEDHPNDVATAARQERDELRAQMRTLPEFADFDREMSVRVVTKCLRERAHDQSEYAAEAVVIINASRWGCDAILITADTPRTLPLEVTVQEIASTIERMTHAMSRIIDMESPDGEHDPRESFQSVLDWLWQRVAEPILRKLNFVETPADTARWPRVHWCASGLFRLLPLHAAEGASGAVIDRVVSTYLVNLADFSPGRPEPHPQSLPAVGIAVPELPGAVALKHAQEEVNVAARNLGKDSETLAGENATLYHVIDALQRAGSAHFACHGSPAGADPDRWGIHLYNGPLTMAKIAGLDLSQMRLAYLAACWTGGAGGALDEAANVAAAFRAAGVQHVIAGLWFIGDRYSRELAEKFYPLASHAEEIDTAKVPIALHQTLRELRARRRHHPWMWAPYVHIGT